MIQHLSFTLLHVLLHGIIDMLLTHLGRYIPQTNNLKSIEQLACSGCSESWNDVFQLLFWNQNQRLNF